MCVEGLILNCKSYAGVACAECIDKFTIVNGECVVISDFLASHNCLTLNPTNSNDCTTCM